jgi:hypothetical protein
VMQTKETCRDQRAWRSWPESGGTDVTACG